MLNFTVLLLLFSITVKFTLILIKLLKFTVILYIIFRKIIRFLLRGWKKHTTCFFTFDAP